MNSAYIAGPMKNIKDHNFPAFDECRDYLKEHVAAKVVSPADTTRERFGGIPTDAQITSTVYADLMRGDLENVLRVTGVVLLPGWEQSNGARIEAFVALTVGKMLARYEPRNPIGNRLFSVSRADVLRALLNAFEKELDLVPLQVPIPTPAPVKTTLAADDILPLADKLVSTDRQQDYGHPLDNFTLIADLWNPIIRTARYRDTATGELTAEDVALMLVQLKVSRQMNRNNDDNWVDIAGYAKCGKLVVDERKARESQ